VLVDHRIDDDSPFGARMNSTKKSRCARPSEADHR
jgi:hypothetical protein